MGVSTPKESTERRARALEEKLEPPADDALWAEICRRIRRAVDVEKIILFGSYAYGTPTKDSDIDLLVVADTGQRWHKIASSIHAQLSPRRLALDVLVRTPQQIADAFTDDGFDPFLREVWQKGKVLYERLDRH